MKDSKVVAKAPLSITFKSSRFVVSNPIPHFLFAKLNFRSAPLRFDSFTTVFVRLFSSLLRILLGSSYGLPEICETDLFVFEFIHFFLRGHSSARFPGLFHTFPCIYFIISPSFIPVFQPLFLIQQSLERERKKETPVEIQM